MEINAFKNKVWLATPTMHGDEMKYAQQAYVTNWMSTVGENISMFLKCDILRKTRDWRKT